MLQIKERISYLRHLVTDCTFIVVVRRVQRVVPVLVVCQDGAPTHGHACQVRPQ